MEKTTVVQNENEGQAVDSPESDLEQMLIKQYLADKGYMPADLKDLLPEEAKRLFTEASQYASLKLTEIEATTDLWVEVQK
jgi:hypothetical protein